jgi:hypothetical protein
MADEEKPYAELFSTEDREAARARLVPQWAAIERRKQARTERVAARRSELPGDLDRLRSLAADVSDPEGGIAINQAILEQAPRDTVTLNRLGCAYEGVGLLKEVRRAFLRCAAVDPKNEIARGRLRELERSLERRRTR